MILQDDMKFIYSIGEQNGIFKWAFYGDKEINHELAKHYEELVDVSKKSLKDNVRNENETFFKQEDLQNYTQQQIDQMKSMLDQPNLT